MEVTPGINIYYNSAKLCYVADLNEGKPCAMFKDIFKRLLPDSVRLNPALSRTGTRKTKGVPDDIKAAATGELFLKINFKWFCMTFQNSDISVTYDTECPSKDNVL